MGVAAKHPGAVMLPWPASNIGTGDRMPHLSHMAMHDDRAAAHCYGLTLKCTSMVGAKGNGFLALSAAHNLRPALQLPTSANLDISAHLCPSPHTLAGSHFLQPS